MLDLNAIGTRSKINDTRNKKEFVGFYSRISLALNSSNNMHEIVISHLQMPLHLLNFPLLCSLYAGMTKIASLLVS